MSEPPADRPDEEKWPISFLVIVALVALYLGWRLIQGIIWVVDKF